MTVTLACTIDEIDASWLTSVLRDAGVLPSGEHVDIVAADPVGVDTAFGSNLFRLRLDGPAGSPGSVIVKLPVSGPSRTTLDALDIYRREVLFYRELAPELPLRFPIAYLALGAPKGTDFVLVLEDLADLVAVDQHTGLTVGQARVAAAELARFHAWAWNRAERLEPLADRIWPLNSPAGSAFIEGLAGAAMKFWHSEANWARELVDPATARICDHYLELLPFFIDQLSTPRTIVHGDLRADNLFFDKERLVPIDFHTVSQEAGIREIAYLFSQSLPIELAERHEQNLARYYWEQLLVAGVEDYPWDRAWEQYRIAVAVNLLFPLTAASLRSDDQGARGDAVIVDMLQRASASIVRNDSLRLLPGPAGLLD